jgi:hypothetical protein
MKYENPNRQLGYLQQCLSSDKKPLGLFLGAGCPTAIRNGDDEKSSLIPDIAGITKLVRSELTKDKACVRLLQTVEEHFKKDGRINATVEDLLTHVRALRAVAGEDRVRGLTAKELDQLDDRVCQLIYLVADKTLPNGGTPYHSLAAWVDAVRRENPVEVFTTNYDLLMEQAFEDCRVPYFDGFAGARKPFFDLRAMEEDMLPPRWARLWKLHGSINWYQVPKRGVFRGNTQGNEGARRVIHPSHLKYQESRRMPYLAMIDRVRAFLKKPAATLILCGYSFRDEHINEVILQCLESSQTAIAFALLFGVVANYPEASSLARTHSNLSILAQDAAVISGQESKWLERDAESAAAENSKWLNWTPIDPANKDGKQRAALKLGDFVVFGKFLQELVGTTHQPQEVINA